MTASSTDPGARVLGLIVLDDRLRMVPADRPALAAEAALLLEAAAAARAAGDPEQEWRTLRPAGVALIALGEPARARTALERCLELATARGRPFREVAALVNLGDSHRYAGDPAAAGPCYTRAVAVARAAAPEALSFALHHRGKHLTEAGRLPEAVAALREAEALRRAGGDPELLGSTLLALRAAGADA